MKSLAKEILALLMLKFSVDSTQLGGIAMVGYGQSFTTWPTSIVDYLLLINEDSLIAGRVEVCFRKKLLGGIRVDAMNPLEEVRLHSRSKKSTVEKCLHALDYDKKSEIYTSFDAPCPWFYRQFDGKSLYSEFAPSGVMEGLDELISEPKSRNQ